MLALFDGPAEPIMHLRMCCPKEKVSACSIEQLAHSISTHSRGSMTEAYMARRLAAAQTILQSLQRH